MILGQSAATAISMALDEKIALQDVNYPKLRERLLADGQLLEWTGKRAENDQPITLRPLAGLLIDDMQSTKTGAWANSTRSEFRIGTGYIHDGNDHKGELSIALTPAIPTTGDYEIFFVFTPNANRASNVPVTLTIGGKEVKTVIINQKLAAGEGLLSLGKYTLPKGTGTTVTVSNKGTNGYVVVDGLQVVPVKSVN